MKSSQGLTVIEALVKALVVLFTLGVIMTLLFPAVDVGIRPAQRAQARNDVTQIATAVIAFETEYGQLPGAKRGVVGGPMLAALMGLNTNLNPRGLVFLEVDRVTNTGRSGMNGDGEFVDPWGGRYRIAFATGTNNWVIAGTNGTFVKKRVAVWSDPNLGAAAASVDDQKKPRRAVNSWD